MAVYVHQSVHCMETQRSRVSRKKNICFLLIISRNPNSSKYFISGAATLNKKGDSEPAILFGLEIIFAIVNEAEFGVAISRLLEQLIVFQFGNSIYHVWVLNISQ